MSTKITVGICGSTGRTVQCGTALAADDSFDVRWVITPPPKPIGRKKVITPSPLESWAVEQSSGEVEGDVSGSGIPVLHVHKKIGDIRAEIEEMQATRPVDILLVVDFGYLIPPWLLELPRVAPVNIHPSDLPKYRGSSPAQFALLAGETESAVCIMRLIWELDAGPIIKRLPFAVPPSMTQTEYYAVAFELASSALPGVLERFVKNGQSEDQPEDSPTVVAARLSREDGFVPGLQAASSQPEGWRSESEVRDERGDGPTISGAVPEGIWDGISETVKSVVQKDNLSLPALLDRMVRAFSPWPGVWTTVGEYKGRRDVRLKVLEGTYDALSDEYDITRWQYDGE